MAVGDRLAVLKDGVVEQIGSSDDLYNYPQNPFVANFIGKMNFFNGKVTNISGDTIEINLANNLSFSLAASQYRSESSLAIGDAVLIAARPEHLIVEKSSNQPHLDGEVTIIQHLGHIVRYEVKVASSHTEKTLEIDMEGRVPGINEKDIIHISFKTPRLTIYKKDR
jgi:ABC-type sugar transport system ATPase subunit